MPRVLISDKMELPGLEILRNAGIELDERPGLKGEELKAALRLADGGERQECRRDRGVWPSGGDLGG